MMDRLISLYKKLRPDVEYGRVVDIETDIAFDEIITVPGCYLSSRYSLYVSGKIRLPSDEIISIRGKVPIFYKDRVENVKPTSNIKLFGKAISELGIEPEDIIRVSGWKRDFEFILLNELDVVWKNRGVSDG